MMSNKMFVVLKANLINAYSLRKILQGDKKDAVKRIAMSVLIGLSIAYLFAMVFGIFLITAEQLKTIHSENMLLAIAIIVFTVTILFSSVIRASSYLFTFKDHDLLMSLPIKEGDVLLSKLIMFFVSNLLICAFFYAPAVIVYGIVTQGPFLFYVLAALLFFFVPIIPMIFGIAMSFPLSYIASRLRATNLFMLISSLLAVGFAIFIQRFMFSSTNTDILKTVSLAQTVIGLYFPANSFVEALGEFNIVSLAIFVIGNLIILYLFLKVFGKLFKKINSLMTEKPSTSKYKMRELSVSSKVTALYKKELKTYFSSYVYILNTAMGVIMFTFFLGTLFFFDYETVMDALSLPSASMMIFPVVVMLGSVCCAMSATTAPSISIEGKSIWIPKSLPINFSDIAKSKIFVSLTVVIPIMFIDSIIMSFLLKFSLTEWLVFMAVIVSVSIFSALIGLVANLHFPKMDWKSPVHAIKQSFSVFTALIINLVVAITPFMLYFVFGRNNFYIFAVGIAAVLLMLSLALWYYIKIFGAKMFYRL